MRSSLKRFITIFPAILLAAALCTPVFAAEAAPGISDAPPPQTLEADPPANGGDPASPGGPEQDGPHDGAAAGNETYQTAAHVLVNTAYAAVSEHSSDWYMFTLPQPGVLRLAFQSGVCSASDCRWDLDFYLDPTDASYFPYSFSGAATRHTTGYIGLDSGTYYIRINPKAHSPGTDYSFFIEYAPSAHWEREPNNTHTAADSIALNTWYYGSNLPGNYDWYRFSVPAGGVAHIYFQNDYFDAARIFWYLHLYGVTAAGHGDPLWEHSVSPDTTARDLGNITLREGDYYLRIQHDTFTMLNYSFSIQFTRRTGWVALDEGWTYLLEDGNRATGWLHDGEAWYCLSPNGIMQTGWYSEENTWYLLGGSGALRYGWCHDGWNWYYMNPDFGGAMQRGWMYANGWYYFTNDGMMVTGWNLIDGVWYRFDGSGLCVE